MYRLIFVISIIVMVSSLKGQETDSAIGSEFSFRLYKQLALEAPQKNVLFSPYSILQAVAMTYDGAQGETKAEMAQTLGFRDNEAMGAEFKRMNNILLVQSDSVNLEMANSLWAQKGYRYLDTYFANMLQNYNAPANYGNYKTEKGRVYVSRKINKWVSHATHNNIEKLINANDLQENTRLVIANAIWFNANWLKPFSTKETKVGEFHYINNTNGILPMMHNRAKFNYLQSENYQALEMPYKNEKLAMLVILPTADSLFALVEHQLSAVFINSLVQQMENTYLHVQFPRFESQSELNLKEVLLQMGMEIAFTDSADFTGITGKADLKIDKIIHKATVDVSETGTEAAAATAVVMIRKTAIIREIKFTANRPFIYIIRHMQTGQILFMGRFVNTHEKAN